MKRVTKQEMDDLTFLQEQERVLVAERGLEDFYFFVMNILWPDNPGQLYEPLHKPICDKVSGFKPGTRDLLIMMRKGRKTNVRTIALCCWLLARDIDIRIMVISSLDRTAKDFLAAVKRQLQQNKSLLHYYPHLRVNGGKLGNELAFTHPARTKFNLVDPTMYATYLGAPLVGRRFDVCIMDDPIDDEDVSTPEQASKCLRFLNTVFPLADENDRWNWVVVNGTRKGFNDMYAALLGQAMGSEVDAELGVAPFTSTIIPALADENGDPDINGEPTYPTVLSREVLLGYLNMARANPAEGEGYFFREFLCMCQAPSEQKFLDEWFNSWTPVLPPVVWSGIVVDSATKDKQVLHKGDFTVALVVHFDVHGHLYVTDGTRSDGFRFNDLTRELLVLAERAGGVYNIVKEKVGEEIFFPAVEDYFHRARKPCTTYPVSVRQEGKKVVRIINALQGAFAARQVHFVGDGRPVAGVGFPWSLWRVLKDELTHLGQWSHDDAADALSLAMHRDVKIVPSARRGVAWTPMYNARPPQAGLERTNMAAVRMRAQQSNWQSGDGSMRGQDPFATIMEEQMSGLSDNKRPPLPSLPMIVEEG